MHSRQEEGQNHSHSTLSNTQQAEEQLRAARTSSYHFLNEIPNLAFQTTEKDVGGKHNSFMGKYVTHYLALLSLTFNIDVSFFPSPTITDPWGEIPTPNLSWDSATKSSFSVNKAISTAETDASMLETAPERGELESDRSVGTGPQLDSSASIDARLSQVLKAVNAAGFDSLDSAVIAYYKKSSKGNDGLRQEQRLNRMRRLPVLLKELHHSAQGWGQWERRNFQEQIIRSTEDILFAELEDHLASRRTSPQNSPYGNEQRGASHQNEEDETDVEAEVSQAIQSIKFSAILTKMQLPNTWTLLTSLSTKYSIIASQDWEGDMPKLVGKFLAAGNELGS